MAGAEALHARDETDALRHDDDDDEDDQERVFMMLYNHSCTALALLAIIEYISCFSGQL